MAYVFISYSHADKNAAATVESHLRAMGIECFRDDSSINHGTSLWGAISTAIPQCKVFVLLASRLGLASPWVQQEIALARVSGLMIVPILLDTTVKELPGYLQEIKVLDLRGHTQISAAPHIHAFAQEVARRKQRDSNNAVMVIGSLAFLVLALCAKE